VLGSLLSSPCCSLLLLSWMMSISIFLAFGPWIVLCPMAALVDTALHGDDTYPGGVPGVRPPTMLATSAAGDNGSSEEEEEDEEDEDEENRSDALSP